MSSYNNIEKIKYASEDCVVTLREYIVFENERAEEKFVVFKFSNNVSQQLLGMEFEVSQYDIDNNLVEKSVVIYNKFLAKPSQPFVPKAKLKVNYLCKTLSVRLIQAAFDRFIWKEGEFLDNSYKFEHYARDEDTEAAKRLAPAAPVNVKAQKPAPAPKKRKGRLPFTAKNSMRKNIAKFPGVFNAFVCIVVFVAIGLSIHFFNSDSTTFVADNFYYKITSDKETLKTVTVTRYIGDEADITIPATVKGYSVTRISKNAFKNSDIESVQFNSAELYIESFAFEGCENLTTVSSMSIVVPSVAKASSKVTITVLGNAFKDCTKLETVLLPNASLSNNSLSGCTGVKHLICGSVTESIDAVFGGNAPEDLEYLIMGSVVPDPDPEPDPDPDPEPGYAYGDLKDLDMEGYVGNEYYEAINGVLMTVNPDITELSIEDVALEEGKITEIGKNAYSQLGKITTLSVYSDSMLTSAAMQACTNVKILIIESHDEEAPPVDLTKFKSLTALSIPCYKDVPITLQYSLPGYLSSITLKPSDSCKVIPENAFIDLNVKEIVVEEGFTSCGTNIVSKNSCIEIITLPKGINYGEGVIGSNCINLATLDIYLENCDTPYEEINLSYQYTINLTVRMDIVPYRDGGDGYLYYAHTYIKELTIIANDSSIELMDFVCGGFPDEVNCPTVTFNIPGLDDEEYEWFVSNYPTDKIQNS